MKFSIKEVLEYSKTLNVVYAEDNDAVREMTAELLDHMFANLYVAKDGQEAIELYEKHYAQDANHIDLVFTDLNMPRKDGFEFLKVVYAHNPQQEVVVISAHNESMQLLKLIELGVSKFLLKPLEHAKLLQAVHEVSKRVVLQKKHKEFLLKQAQLASMGEMIDVIAHQWLSPIGIMRLRTLMMQEDFSSDHVSEDACETFLNDQLRQIEHLTQTLSEFRGFFREQNMTETISLKQLIESVLLLMKDYLVKHTMRVDIQAVDDTLMVNVYPNEFKHVIINLFNNAAEAYNEQEAEPEKRVMRLETESFETTVALRVRDQAGGIPEAMLEEVFQPKVTTKKTGTGVGLYLCKQILHKVEGEIGVHNQEGGSCFVLTLPKA